MMEFIIAFLLLLIVSSLVPILFGIVLIYIVWRILKKKEWV
jgi:hypothetical protein